MDAEEIGYIRNLLKKQGYLGGCESDNNNDAPSAEPEEKPEEGQFPLTICDTGDGEECFVTFENGDEMIEYFNDEFAAARGEEFKTIADCMEWIDESYYLSVVSEKGVRSNTLLSSVGNRKDQGLYRERCDCERVCR